MPVKMEDYEIDYETICPFCGNKWVHFRGCTDCNDGYIDLYNEDPLWFRPGQTEKCHKCSGTGVEIWCPECGSDLSGFKFDN